MKEVVEEKVCIQISFVNKLSSRVHLTAIKVDFKYIRHFNTYYLWHFPSTAQPNCADSPFVDKEPSCNVPQRASEKFLPH